MGSPEQVGLGNADLEVGDRYRKMSYDDRCPALLSLVTIGSNSDG